MIRLNAGDHVVDFIDDALYGLLDEMQTQYVFAHCEQCPICAVAMKEGRGRKTALQALGGRGASEDLIRNTTQRVVREADRTLKWRSWVRRASFVAAAACVVILASFHLYYYMLKPSVYDLRVLGQTELMPDSRGSLRAQLLRSGEPAPGAEISIDVSNATQTVHLASFTTDASGSGSPRFTVPDWPDGSYTLRVTASTGWGAAETVTEGIKLKRSWKLMLSTDKPVYQPGQMIHLRSLALRQPDLKPVAGREATFTIADPRGNIIFKQVGVTSAYGISAADCALATEIIEGDYSLACRIGDTESKATVEVKHYVLPKFKVALTLDQPFYQPGQRVRGRVEADYFFGKHMAGGTVELTAQGADAGQARLMQRTVNTDADGVATFDFVLPQALIGTPSDGGDARFVLTAKVSDTAGQEQERSISTVVTASPIHVDVIAESGRLVRGVANRVYVLTSYPDGRPAKTRVAASGVEKPLETSELGACVLEMTPAAGATGAVTLNLSVTDAAGLRAQKTAILECDEAATDYLLRTDKAVCQSGQTLHLQAFGGGTEPVFIDLIKDGQTLLTRTMEMKGGGSLALDLPPDLFGTVELVGYRYGAGALPVRKTRMLYIQQADDVEITTKLDHSEYRPGAPAKLTFEVTDHAGNPVPGALSLSAVDEAVFSVLEQRTGMEKTFFNLEREQLKPVYAIYPWDPFGAGGGADRQLLDEALFSRTAGAATDRDAVLQRLVADGTISPRMLRSLGTPWGQSYLRQMIDNYDLSPDLKAAILNAGPHRLEASTGPENVVRVERIRASKLEAFPYVWMALGVALVLGFSFMLGGSGCLVRTFVIFIVTAFLIAIMLPSLGRAREMARRTSDATNVNEALKSLVVSDSVKSLLPAGTGAAEPRVREFFPETLLWRPELITDDKGRASIDIDMADSITTWRLSASAVTADGRLGATSAPIKVFQPFFVDLNLPVALTQGDEVAVPAVVYNYLDKPQTVELTLAADGWFTALDGQTKSVSLGAGQVASVSFRIRATKSGSHSLQVAAKAGDVADAVRRNVEITPNGRMVEQVVNGSLANPVDLQLVVPADALEGSVKATLKLYPSAFSQLVEGMDGIFQAPYGCFEQTSSTTYPNVLALDYLRRANKSVPAVEATARQFINLGYQRLLSFEIAGGGFDWFGRPAANTTLSAYGLLEFQDMAKVHNVDPAMIQRTRRWLLDQRAGDGSWAASGHPFYHGDPVRGSTDARLATTAYTAWAVFMDGAAVDAAGPTRTWLHEHLAEARDNPYTLGLLANALLAIDPQDADALAAVGRLDALKQMSTDGKMCNWTQTNPTAFYGDGASGSAETTALAALAMIHTQQYPATSRQALAWLISQKDAHGTWHSTQATVLALKALIEGTGKPLGGEKARTITLRNGTTAETIIIPANQAEVMKQIDITGRLPQAGTTAISLADTSGTATEYQVTLRYYVPAAAVAVRQPLAVDVTYDRSEIAVGQRLTATATISNNTGETMPMILLDLPIPAGFGMDVGDLQAMVDKGVMAKFQMTPRSAIVYLRELPAGGSVGLKYHLEATMPVRVTAPPATVYEYYKPENRGQSEARSLVVNGA